MTTILTTVWNLTEVQFYTIYDSLRSFRSRFCFVRCKQNNKTQSGYLLRLVIWGLTDAVQLLRAALLAPFTLHTDIVVHLLRLLLCDAHTVSVIPVSAKVAADVKPAHGTRGFKALKT